MMERAEGARAGGFAAVSTLAGELAAWEADGRSLPTLRRELELREAPVNCVDPFVAWYPGYEPGRVRGEASAHLRASEDDVLRYCEELGAPFVTVVAPFVGRVGDFGEVVERLGRFADRAATVGVRPHLEMVPTTLVPDLASALALVRAVDRPNLGLLVDTYNLCRGGMVMDELDDVPLELVFELQLADAPAVAVGDSYFADALHRRQLPGLGELPVHEIVARLAAKGPLPPTGPEVFADDLAEMPAVDAARLAGQVTRDFLASAGGLTMAAAP
jgi:sugar phosphate isomerase/epimerase